MHYPGIRPFKIHLQTRRIPNNITLLSSFSSSPQNSVPFSLTQLHTHTHNFLSKMWIINIYWGSIFMLVSCPARQVALLLSCHFQVVRPMGISSTQCVISAMSLWLSTAASVEEALRQHSWVSRWKRSGLSGCYIADSCLEEFPKAMADFAWLKNKPWCY